MEKSAIIDKMKCVSQSPIRRDTDTRGRKLPSYNRRATGSVQLSSPRDAFNVNVNDMSFNLTKLRSQQQARNDPVRRSQGTANSVSAFVDKYERLFY